jgi:dihydroorotase
MPNTNPTSDKPEVLDYIYKRASEVGICRILPTAAVSLNLQGKEHADYALLAQHGAIAFTDDGKGVQDSAFFTEALKRIAKTGKPFLDHSEDESLSLGGAIHFGEVAQKFGVKGIDPRSESEHVRRGCEVSAITNCHFHVLHISTKESIEYVREAKKRGLKVTAEVSPHHLLLCDEDISTKADGSLDANFKMNPPLRSKVDMLAARAALLDGTIDMIATDHAPHTEEEKAQGIEQAPFGIIGLETAFPLVYTHFVKTGELTLKRLTELMIDGPCRLFDLGRKGLNVDDPADLVIIDTKLEKTILKENIFSKSKNTPFLGRVLQGFPTHTIFQGKVVYKDKDC